MIETFTGNEISAEKVLDNVNHPRNAFNIQGDAHDSFDALTWGIQAVSADGQVNHFRGSMGYSKFCPQ
jgi:hypothetical protein